MRIDRRWFLGIAVLLLPLLAVGIGARANSDDKESTVRWDIVLVGGGNLRAGGTASALNNIDTKITVTGSGTFVPGEPSEVTGGGDFKIVDTTGHVLTGSYKVTRLVSFEVAPGTLPALTDQIGDPNNARAGLAVLRIRYSDGRRGILLVSCHLVGTPDFVFEGITASRASADFWNRQRPNSASEPFVDANRTVFHIVPEAED